MEQFTAESFLAVGMYLERVKATTAKNLKERNLSEDEMINPEESPEESIFAKNLNHVRERCTKIGLTVSIHCVDHILAAVSKPVTSRKVLALIDQLGLTIAWEMQERLFMFIPPQRAERYDKEELFGSEVKASFPSATFDIKESGNSFASARFTACVFHLMRVLEIGLVTFAKLFPSVPTNKENWQQIIEKIESEIREMPKAPTKAPDWKEKMEQYAQTANSFMFFKDAWRNYTAHARGKYTEDEADSVYRNVRSFMQSLAKAGMHE